MSIPEGYNFIKHLVEQGRALEVFEIIVNLRKASNGLQLELMTIEEKNQRMLAAGDAMANYVRLVPGHPSCYSLLLDWGRAKGGACPHTDHPLMKCLACHNEPEDEGLQS